MYEPIILFFIFSYFLIFFYLYFFLFIFYLFSVQFLFIFPHVKVCVYKAKGDLKAAALELHKITKIVYGDVSLWQELAKIHMTLGDYQVADLVFLCVCACMHACTYLCMYACMYVCACIYICIFVCMYVDMYVCIYVCMYVCLWMYVLLYVCVWWKVGGLETGYMVIKECYKIREKREKR